MAAKLNPHFKQVDWQAWIARKNGKPVGRIMAQIYKPEAPAPVEASRAQFGSLDAIDDPAVIAALTRAAEQWLRDAGRRDRPRAVLTIDQQRSGPARRWIRRNSDGVHAVESALSRRRRSKCSATSRRAI